MKRIIQQVRAKMQSDEAWVPVVKAVIGLSIFMLAIVFFTLTLRMI